jgi:hypothetical protein
VAVPAGAIPALLLAQRAELDLVGLTELATRELAPGWPADAVQPRAAGVAELLGWPTGPNASGRSDWSLLAELDSRTSAIEALTKFVASPSGFRVAEAMAPYRLGVLGLAVALAKRRLRLGDLGYTARAVFDADRARRVPPRIYLSKGGDTVLDYQGLTPRTRRLGVLGRIRSLLTRAYS